MSDEKKQYVVVIKCLSYEDAKKTRCFIEKRMGYSAYIDEVKT